MATTTEPSFGGTTTRVELLELVSSPSGWPSVVRRARIVSPWPIVTDGGPGISESQVMTIWDPFHSTNAPGRQDAGSGLSLAVTKSLVEKMGGTVEAISKHGKGTTLRVRLPRAEVTA